MSRNVHGFPALGLKERSDHKNNQGRQLILTKVPMSSLKRG